MAARRAQGILCPGLGAGPPPSLRTSWLSCPRPFGGLGAHSLELTCSGSVHTETDCLSGCQSSSQQRLWAVFTSLNKRQVGVKTPHGRDVAAKGPALTEGGIVGTGDTPKGATQTLLSDRDNIPIINTPAPVPQGASAVKTKQQTWRA